MSASPSCPDVQPRAARVKQARTPRGRHKATGGPWQQLLAAQSSYAALTVATLPSGRADHETTMADVQPSVLIVDDDTSFAHAAADYARERGFDTAIAHTLQESRRAMDAHPSDLTLLELSLPDGNAFDLLGELDADAHRRIALLSDDGSSEVAERAGRWPLLDYLVKPLEPEHFDALLSAASAARAVAPRWGGLIGECEAMRQVASYVERIAPTRVSVLVTGESGTGKELVARAVHERSRRRGAFVAVNCGAIAPDLLASHLFGHERGSFTGAAQRHAGYFEQAHRGTLFLDEITEMPPALQVYLLRVLETGEVTRVGGSEAIPVDVRIVAACNRDPQQAIDQGQLRADLFYRLADFILPLPPLRARGNDVVLLARYFVDQLNAEHGESKRLSADAERILRAHHWPGNVRELRSAVQRAFFLSDGPVVDVHPVAHRAAQADANGAIVFRVGMSYADVEREMLLRTLEEVRHDKTRAARMLGVSVRTIHNQLARMAPPVRG
ncbi:sigma-54-dependent Fis family transcriptional regulator [Lysobacter sp. N42]|nr:sigma-54-dependent Fis family transcriptional regulator [Lysobacter sp. N42]